MGSVVTIASNEDVSSVTSVLFAVGPDGVGKAWCHVGNSEGEGVMETGGNNITSPSVLEWVSGVVIGPDAILVVVRFVVVDEELILSVVVEGDIGDVVSAEDVGVIDDNTLNKRTVLGRDSVHADLLVEELSGKDDNFVLVSWDIDDLDADIGDISEAVLNPGYSGIETLGGMLEPKEFTLASLGVGASSDKVLTSISVEVDPVAHVIEVTLLVGVNLDGRVHSGEVSLVHAHHVEATIVVAWHKEAVGHHDGTLAEDIIGDDLDIVGPHELEVMLQLLGIELANITINDGFFDVRDNEDLTVREWHARELRDEKEVVGGLKLAEVDKGGMLQLEVLLRSELKIGGGGGGGSEGGAEEGVSKHIL